VGIGSLPDEHRRRPRAPESLCGCQDVRLVVHKNVMLGGIATLDVIEGLFFMDIDKHASAHSVRESGVLDLAGLKDDIAI
jgi:hypothetical protein